MLALTSQVLSSNAQSCSGQTSYFVASMNMTIDPGSQDFITSAISDAQASCANHFVLVMNTFGGNGKNMDNIINAISKYQAAGDVHHADRAAGESRLQRWSLHR